jgi:hypothetical protein
MNRLRLFLLCIFLLLCFSNLLSAQDSTEAKNEQESNPGNNQFVDRDGDGYNDNAPDHDHDGIPNALDPDFQEMMKKKSKKKVEFLDLDGDGINDLETSDPSGIPGTGQKAKGQVEKSGSMNDEKVNRQKKKQAGRR